jgi:hypothetical protein
MRRLQLGGGGVEATEDSETGLATESKRSPSEECTVKGGRSLWIQNPREAFRRADVIVIMKSGAARVRGHNIPGPP